MHRNNSGCAYHKKIFESDLSVVVFTIAGAIIVYGAVLITSKDKFAMKFFNPIISNLKKGVKSNLKKGVKK